MEQATVVVAWFAALVSGVFGGLAVSQAVTGRPTTSMISRRTKWSVGELKVLGLGWAVYWLALAVFALVGSLNIAANRVVLFLPLTLSPILLGGPIFHLLMEQRHNGRWPFKERVSHT
jgi:hypothetical protein